MGDDGVGCAVMLVIAAMLSVLMFGMGMKVGKDTWYKQGQIDALSGTRIQYELCDMSDGSKQWVRIQLAEKPE